jgi:hypothetical protein
MTPKDKAKQLVDKFYPRATSYSLDAKNQNENAKQCSSNRCNAQWFGSTHLH